MALVIGEKVFVVHGRNHTALKAMYAFLRSIGLSPITWEDAVELTGKPSATTLEIVKAGIEASKCSIVLMTGDDEARLRPEYGPEPLLPQPRPNVIFEAGWALAVAGREKTILVRFGGLRDFSDIDGINMITLDNSPEKRIALLKRLEIAGLRVDKSSDIYLNSGLAGDFEQPHELEVSADQILQRGEFTEVLVDSSLSHSVGSLELEKEINAYLRDGLSPNLKYNYLGALGAQNWLDLTEDPTYGHSDITFALKESVTEIAQKIAQLCQRIDLVSLGPGDGLLDVQLLSELQKVLKIVHYYPIDLSVELLQKTVSTIVKQGPWFNKQFLIKAIHGDFYQLARYKPIYAFDSAPNFISLIGYTFGNHDESELLGKLREGMEDGDFLLVDARLLEQNQDLGRRLTDGQITDITKSYSHALNNRFAFGPVEALTLADYATVDFNYEISSRRTSVPGAINIITYIKNLNTRFRRSRRKLSRKRLDLAVTTLYQESQLEEWFRRKGFSLLWKKTLNRTILLLLRKK